MTLKSLVGNHLYRMGDSGPVVTQIQTMLREIGYPLKGTGYFGNATDTAVRAIQRRAAIKVDGVVGANTADVIGLLYSTPIIPPPSVVAETERPLWLQAGLGLMGTKEGPGAKDNPAIIDWAKDLGADIAKEYTHDSIPWCSLFANHCLAMASLPGTGTLWALDFAGKWPSKQLSGPAVGAFAPMLRSGGGHIIQVVGRTKSGNVLGLGGNQSDSVSEAEFPLARLNKGFWWPASVALPNAVGFSHLPLVDSKGRISSSEA